MGVGKVGICECGCWKFTGWQCIAPDPTKSIDTVTVDGWWLGWLWNFISGEPHIERIIRSRASIYLPYTDSYYTGRAQSATLALLEALAKVDENVKEIMEGES